MRIVSRQPSEVRPARMAQLAVLPVFLDLRGKRAVVAGGTDAAAWKAELLAAAGAEVTVVAPAGALDDEMRRLLSGERILYRDAAWSARDLKGAAVAVADAGTPEAAAAFHAAARTAGVPVNVIDRPDFCTFQFGSIVNRSPVVVGISTSGAAPILGQAIRRRVETLLPASLAAWAALARGLRGKVGEMLPPGEDRRGFWEAFVDRAFGPPAGKADERALLDEIGRRAKQGNAGRGSVTLVGAGPGDPELLTLKAVRALQAADVILFDDLVSDAVLELARREAKRILVGKRGGRESCRQDDINDLMVKLAKAGKRVVRLKSGDPMIFGRAGEEIERLEAEAIPVSVVPGITAGIALASALGVSLTRRGFAASVRFVTGHSSAGGLPRDVDWHALADPSVTTIFYMGGRMAGSIAGRLVSLGMAPHTPAVVAAALGRPGERLTRTTLAGLERAAAQAGSSEPVLIGVGHVFERAEARQAAAAS